MNNRFLNFCVAVFSLYFLVNIVNHKHINLSVISKTI